MPDSETERSITNKFPHSDFSHSLASIPVLEGLLGAVAAPQPRPLGQYELQLGSGSSSDQGPDQGQGVLVEVGLEGNVQKNLQKNCLSSTVDMRESRTLTAKAVPQAKGWVR